MIPVHVDGDAVPLYPAGVWQSHPDYHGDILVRRPGAVGPLLTFDRAPRGVSMFGLTIDNGGSSEPAILVPPGAKNWDVDGLEIFNFTGAAVVFEADSFPNEDLRFYGMVLRGNVRGNIAGFVVMNPYDVRVRDAKLSSCGTLKFETYSSALGEFGGVEIENPEFKGVTSNAVLFRTNHTTRLSHFRLINARAEEIGAWADGEGKGLVHIGGVPGKPGGTIRDIVIRNPYVRQWGGPGGGNAITIHALGATINGVRIEDADLNGAGPNDESPQSAGTGIFLAGAEGGWIYDAVIRRCLVASSGGNGVTIIGAPHALVEDTTVIRANRVPSPTDRWRAGFHLGVPGRGPIVRGCSAISTGYHPDAPTAGFRVYGNLDAKDAYIKDCTAARNFYGIALGHHGAPCHRATAVGNTVYANYQGILNSGGDNVAAGNHGSDIA